MTIKILLTAANGKTGRKILKALSARGASVRAFIRDAAQFDELKSIGAADCAVGNLQSAEDLRAAVRGVDKVLHIGPPMHPDETEITDALLGAATSEGVEHFIYYSVMHPVRREVRHHRLKLDAEEHVIESGLAYTILQPSRYMQHLLPIWSRIVEEGVHSMPFSVEKKFNVVDLEDLAEASAIVATEPGHEFATYELAGPEALSQNEMASIISDITGKRVRAEAVDFKTLEAKARENGFPDDRVEQMLVMNRHYDAHGFRGNPNVLRMILGREPVTYREFVGRLAA